MAPLPVFVAQLLWFVVVWFAVARLVVWPRTRALRPDAALAFWIAPQMFRVLGLGLLVENLSPGMPREFAVATAAGDSLTAALALTAFVGLLRGRSFGRPAAWACTLVGVTDLLIAFPHAVRTGALDHLAAQWYVPVVAGPIMVVAHGAALATLLQSRRTGADAGREPMQATPRSRR